MNTISKLADTIDAGSEPESNLLQLVHEDNAAIAELFFQFTQAEEDDDKQEIFDQINSGLTVHAQLVEELLYPLVVETAEEDDKEEAKKLVAEAEAGNYVASMVLEVLSSMEPSDEYFEAKMTILCELTKKQVKREEKEMFDKLRAADIDFDDIGDEAAERKAELVEDAQGSKIKSKMKSASKSKSKTKSKTKSKSPAKTSARKPASKSAAKSSKPTKKTTSNSKKSGTKPVGKTGSKAGKPAKKSATSKTNNKKAAGAKQTPALVKSKVKSTNKKRSR
jgi:hemerythrin superfamily protein